MEIVQIALKPESEQIHEVDSISFSILSARQLTKYSVLEVISENTSKSGEVQVGGLSDKRLGTYTPNENCHTCRGNASSVQDILEDSNSLLLL